PFGHEGGGNGGGGQQRQRQRQRPARRFVLLGGVARGFALERSGQGDREQHEQDYRDDQRHRVFMWRRRRMHVARERRHHHRGDGQQHQHGSRAGALRVDALRPVAQAAYGEGEAQHKQQVGKDGTDQRGLHHHHQAGFQREQRDEQFRQVAQRGL